MKLYRRHVCKILVFLIPQLVKYRHLTAAAHSKPCFVYGRSLSIKRGIFPLNVLSNTNAKYNENIIQPHNII